MYLWFIVYGLGFIVTVCGLFIVCLFFCGWFIYCLWYYAQCFEKILNQHVDEYFEPGWNHKQQTINLKQLMHIRHNRRGS